MARPAQAVSKSLHLLASTATMGGTRSPAQSLASLALRPEPTRLARLGGNVHRRQLRSREKGGSGVGKTKKGKGTKWMVLVDGKGIPLGALLTSASTAEVKLAEPTMATVKVPRAGGGRPREKPRRVIADKAYDSDGLRTSLENRNIELISPHRRNRTRPKRQDGRPLRRYRKRWIVERSIAWLGNFRRLVVRYDRLLSMYSGFFHVACLLITLRHF